MIKLSAIKKLRLRPGDMVAVTIPDEITGTVIERVRTSLSEWFHGNVPGVRALVVRNSQRVHHIKRDVIVQELNAIIDHIRDLGDPSALTIMADIYKRIKDLKGETGN